MSGVLQNLVGRATGQVSPGLRPRLPSRFEASAADSFVETHQETTATPSAESPAPADKLRSAPLNTPPTDEPAPDPMPDASPAPPRVLTPEPETSSPPAPSHAADPLIEHHVDADPHETASFEPLLEARPERPPDLMPAQPQDQNDPPAVTHVKIAAPTPDERLAEPPAPLLPPEPARSPDTPLSVLAQPPSARETAEHAGPSEPEITIHIGRIDVRSPTPQPTPAPAPAARPMPSLSDYLRRRRS